MSEVQPSQNACPHCGGEIHWRALGVAVPNQSIIFSMKPGSRGVITARAFGAVVAQFGKMVESLSRDAGLNETAFIGGLALEDDGTGKVTVSLVKMKPRPRKSSASQQPSRAETLRDQ